MIISGIIKNVSYQYPQGFKATPFPVLTVLLPNENLILVRPTINSLKSWGDKLGFSAENLTKFVRNGTISSRMKNHIIRSQYVIDMEVSQDVANKINAPGSGKDTLYSVEIVGIDTRDERKEKNERIENADLIYYMNEDRTIKKVNYQQMLEAEKYGEIHSVGKLSN